MKDYIKNEIKHIPFTLMLFILFYGITTLATNYLFNSNEVSYDNTTSGIKEDNVQGAIDELYACTSNYSAYNTRLTNTENKIGTDSLTTTSNTLIGGINEINSKTNMNTKYLNDTSKTALVLLKNDFSTLSSRTTRFYSVRPSDTNLYGFFTKVNDSYGNGVFSSLDGKTYKITNVNGTWSMNELGEVSKQVWSNSNPGSSFASQSISIDLSKYNAIAIVYRYNTSASLYFTHVQYTQNRDVAVMANTNGAFKILTRAAQWSSSKITFHDAYTYTTIGNDSVDNSSMIPITIYGLQ